MRRWIGWTVLLVAILLNCTALGQDYPSRTITLIVPYAAGGGVDAVARVIAEAMGARLGQKIIIENVTGAGGVIGTQRAARSRTRWLHAAIRGREHDGRCQVGSAQHRSVR